MIDLPLTNPVLIFATVMCIVLLAPLLFRRMGIPGIVGLIVAGAIVGPNAIGLLQRGDTFELLGTVGLLYLMFMAGLSLDLNQFAQYRGRSLVFGTLSFLFPMGFSLAVGEWLLGFELYTSLLVGAVVGSHTLLAYPIAARLGLDKNVAVTMTMGGTMVTDLISLLVLAGVSAVVGGETGLGFWVLFVVLVSAYGVLVFAGLPRLGRWFFRTFRRQADMEFVFLLAVVFVTAYVAELVYLAPIIGAFMGGIALNRLVPERSALMLRVQFVGDALFIPFFLISVGMLVDASVLVSGLAVWVFALTFTGLVWSGKLAAAKCAQWIYGYTADEGWTIFGLSTPQAAATLAVTLVGFEMGLFSADVVNAVIVMILFTCLLGPWMVERFGRRVAIQERDKPYEPRLAPQRILVPLANPETADDLMDLAVLLHAEGSAEPIYPATIVPDGSPAQVAEGEELLSRAVVHAAASEVSVVPITRVDFNVVGGIVRAIQEERISTVIIGWHGGSAARAFIFGSVLDQLLEETREMVVMSKIERRINTHQRLLLAIPPFADRESGFADAIRAIKILCDRARMDLVIITPEHAQESLMRRVETARPKVPVEVEAMSRWADLVETLDTLVEPEDLIALLSEREGSVAWRPSLNRLPGVIAQRFPEATFLVIYMSEQPFSTILEGGVDRLEPEALREALRPEDIVLDLQEGPLANVLRQMLRPLIREHLEAAEELLLALQDVEGGYAPELRPGVALYHVHADQIETTRLFVGLSAEGIRLPAVSQPAHVVLVLIGANDLEPEAYLQRLSVVTELVTSDESVDALRQCTRAEEVRELLIRDLREASITSG